MATKLNKVFLNPTEDQIKEYDLKLGYSYFEDMDVLADTLEADQKKKLPERQYSLNNFQIIDGARELKTNLTKIAKVTGFTLSNDLSKVLDWAKTEIEYSSEQVIDHRVASTKAEGTAELSGFEREVAHTDVNRNTFPATAAGQEAYEAAVEAAKDAYDGAGSPVDTKIIGYKDLTLTNVGSKATAVEEGETFAEKKTVVTQYSTADVEGGDASFDYQYDSKKAVDKKDEFLVTETGKETIKVSGAAVGTLSVTNSVIGSVTTSFAENATEVKSLHKNVEAAAAVDDLVNNAGAFETVVIDNSTVLGDVAGGKVTIDNTRTFKNETFLDKPEESGDYYNVISGETDLGVASNNKKLYILADGTSALTEAEAKKLQDQGLTVAVAGNQDNIQVNKYEIITHDVDGNPIESGKFVYLSAAEFANLADANKASLQQVGLAPVGWVDYSSDRVVTDANYLTFDKAPEGAAASNNTVNKYVYQDGGGVKVTYYLTAAEEAALAGAVGKPIYDAGYTTRIDAECVINDPGEEKFRRIAPAATGANYEEVAKTAYSTISTDYKNYTVTTSLSEAEALELNKAAMGEGFVWKEGAASDGKKLFRMSQFTKSGANSVETKYYLSAEEMSAMGFFGEGVSKTYAEVLALAPNGLKLDGWAFTDNVAADDPDRVYTGMYRAGANATTATLANYTIDKTAVVTDVEPHAYQRYELTYTTVNNPLDPARLQNVLGAGQFTELVNNNLVGAASEYVKVIDGQAVNMYQIYGYGQIVNDPAVTVTTEALSLNDAEITYDSVIQEAFWDGDAQIAAKQATLVNGIKTQNTKKYFDPYASNAGEYVAATPAEEKAGEKLHTFITVAEARNRGDNVAIAAGEVVTDVQATIDDGTGKYVAAYIDRTGTKTKDSKDGTDNKEVFYYRGADTKIYALTAEEATAAVALLEGGVATKLKFFTSANDNGWYVNKAAAATDMGVAEDKVTEVIQPKYRDHNVAGITAGNIDNGEYTALTQDALLTNLKNWEYEKAYVTETYNVAATPDPTHVHNYDRVQIDGKDAFIEGVTGTLVTSATTTYDAIYAWHLNAAPAGASVDNLNYYMTEAEAAAAAAKIGEGYPATAVFEKTGAAPIVNGGGDYLYRISNPGLDKSAYLVNDEKYNWATDTNWGAQKAVDNAEAFYDIDYVIGEQVYKYTLAGDSDTYYLTENEADNEIAGAWGTLTKGEKVEGVYHYGTAADYGLSKKPLFTTATTVYYFTDSYSGRCISQDAEGKAVQAFNEDGVIWSNVNGTTWDGGLTKYSSYATEVCANTYFYNYDGGEAWTTTQIEEIAAAETAAGIATWKVETLDGQVVWTRTSAIGEVSTYSMNHAGVALENNEKGNFRKEAAGSIAVINGSEVRGDITGFLNVTVTDSAVDDVYGGNDIQTTTETLSTSKGAINKKDNSRTITTKETEKRERTTTGAGTFTISHEAGDEIFDGAGNVEGFETVTVDGVDITGDLEVSNTKTTRETSTQTTYQGDADALRSNYVDDWANLAFSKGIVSKVTNETTKRKTTEASMGSAEITGRDYEYKPGTGMDTANTVWGDIEGFKKVTLSNVNVMGDIEAEDSTDEAQTTYKLTTKKNVDTATETAKNKTETKVVAELTAVNDVTNPNYEADLAVVGNIEGFKTVKLENYSFADADAVGEKTVSHSQSSVKEAVASDMRLVNAGVNPGTGAVLPGAGSQKYAWGGTTAAGVGTYANEDMSYSSDDSTKRNAVGTLEATGRAYTVVTENYTEDELAGKDPVYAYTQTATGRTVYLTEAQFAAIQSNSKADAAQWTKDEKKTVYYRNSAQAVAYAGAVDGTQVVYKCDSKDASVTLFLTEGEMASYNLTDAVQADLANKELVKSGEAYLRDDPDNKVTFTANTAQVDTASNAVGTVVVKEYSKEGEANQFLTEAEATAGGWTKVDDDEFVRKASKADSEDRSSTSLVGEGAKTKAELTGDLKVYQNKYDSSLIYVLTENEAKFILDTTDKLDDYELVTGAGYRLTGNKAVLGAATAGVATTLAECYNTKIVEAHRYVTLNKYGEVTAQVYVADDEYAKMHAAGKALENYVLDDGTHGAATTQFQYRTAGFVVDADTTLIALAAATTPIAIGPGCELYGWDLTDEQVAAAGLYAPNQKSKYVLEAVTEDPLNGNTNTNFGNIYGYKDVTLTGMRGGDIIRVANAGAVAADNETNKQTYKKTISLGTGKNKGKTTYTENDTTKTSETWSANGTVTVTDSKVGDIAGYKTVNVQSDKGTVEVGQISRTTQGQSFDKSTVDDANKYVTEDTTTSFKVTITSQHKATDTGTAAGSVKLLGKRAGQELVLDDTTAYKTAPAAVNAAQAAIDAHADKQFADVIITGGVVGYQDVTVENATITAGGVAFDGGKVTMNTVTNRTTVAITDNNNDTVTVMSKIADSTNNSNTATGSLTLTNVNYADPNGYVAGSTPIVAGTDYTLVNEYVFNGVTYALTAGEEAALLEYGDLKPRSSTPGDNYVNVLRKNDTITTPAIELTGSLQDVFNAKGVQASGLLGFAQDDVYYAAKAKEGDLYILADDLNEVLDGTIAHPGFTEIVVDTTKKYYGAGGGSYETKAAFEAGIQVAANVKKYVVTEDGNSTTYYLTDAEAAVMKDIAGMDVKAASDTTVYTRMDSVTTDGPAVTVNAAGIVAADGAKADVFEFRGVVKNTGVSVSYYLTDAEAEALLAGDDYANFGKVGTTTYFRNPADIGGDLANATAASLRYGVKEYADGVGPNVFLTDAEFVQIKAIDDAYANYAKVDDDVLYRAAKSAFTIADTDELNEKFTSVNESEKVYEVTNILSAKVLGYLTKAELLAVAGPEFAANYAVDALTTYLRAADDTTDIIKINAFKEGDGYVIPAGGDLSDALFNAAVNEAAAPAKASASGYQKVTLTNADMGNLTGGNHTAKTSEKLAAKKNSAMATYTTTNDAADTATGTLTATDSEIGNASWYEKVSLTAAKMDKDHNRAGNIRGGKVTNSVKTVYATALQANKGAYNKLSAIEYTETTKTNETATGSAILENVVAGSILGYKDVTVSFNKAIDDTDKTKNQIGDVTGGNAVTNITETTANVAAGHSYGETVTKETTTSVGTVGLINVYANNGLVAADVSGFASANVTDSEITGDLTGGNMTVTTTEVDVDGVTASRATEYVVTATGKANVEASTVGGDIAQFKDVALTGGVEVGGNIIVGGDDAAVVRRGAVENTACYAVFYKDSEDFNNSKVVYLTTAEYKVFVTKEPTAMLDTTVAVYRAQPALSDIQLKNPVTAVAAMKGFQVKTDDPITDGGAGVEGKDTDVWTVKTAGNSLTIDEDGAKVGGKVKGFVNVTVSGDSSFGAGYFGTDKADKLTVDEKVGLATFTTPGPLNPVGFDFGDGKDELVLNGTIGIEAAFKYDEEAGTNAWNLEKVSGSGTIVCRTEDVKDVEAAFDGIKAVGSDNYNVVTALDYQAFDDAKNVINTDDIDEWLGFCDVADFFQNNIGGLLPNKTLSFTGDSVTSGDIVAQMSVDGGNTWSDVKNGDTIYAGAVVRVSQVGASSSKASNDYTIAFK